MKRYTSAAAGAYQFLPGTWREVSAKLGLRSFEPHNQDQAALYLVQRRRALTRIDRQGLNREVMAGWPRSGPRSPTAMAAVTTASR